MPSGPEMQQMLCDTAQAAFDAGRTFVVRGLHRHDQPWDGDGVYPGNNTLRIFYVPIRPGLLLAFDLVVGLMDTAGQQCPLAFDVKTASHTVRVHGALNGVAVRELGCYDNMVTVAPNVTHAICAEVRNERGGYMSYSPCGGFASLSLGLSVHEHLARL